MNSEAIHNGPVSAAKAIKKELKERFPGIKFGVRTKQYSGGNSINIDWVMGPTDAAVKKIVDKYAYGRFDGMTDLSYSEDTLMSCPDGSVKVLGGAKFVFTERKYAEDWRDSEAFRERVARDVCALQKVEYKDMTTNVHGGETYTHTGSVGRVVGEILSANDLTKGYGGLKWKADVCGGSWDELIEIIPEKA